MRGVRPAGTACGLAGAACRLARGGPFEGLLARLPRLVRDDDNDNSDRGATAPAGGKVREKRSRRARGSLLLVNRGIWRLVARLLVLVRTDSGGVETWWWVRGTGLRGRRSSGARTWGRLGSRDLDAWRTCLLEDFWGLWWVEVEEHFGAWVLDGYFKGGTRPAYVFAIGKSEGRKARVCTGREKRTKERRENA